MSLGEALSITMKILIPYFGIGLVITWFYQKRGVQTYVKSRGYLPHEAWVGIAMGLMTTGWPFLAPYEWWTKFKRWR